MEKHGLKGQVEAVNGGKANKGSKGGATKFWGWFKETYGPKGQAKANKDSKQQVDFDITVGLSECPPWLCSLCNMNASCRQSLMKHAEGKKHRGKARAIHAEKAMQPEEAAPDAKPQLDETQKGTTTLQDASGVDTVDKISEAEDGNLPLKKERKLEESKNDESSKKTKDSTSGDGGDGKVIQNGKAEAKRLAKAIKDSKKQVDFDITVGLSECPPWFCSLCNTNATSRQTLMLHAKEKKHRGNARAIHAAKQKAMQPEEAAPDTKSQPEETPKGTEEPKVQDASGVEMVDKSFEAENGNLLSKKKRKLEESKNDDSRKKTKDTTSGDAGNGKVIQNGKAEANGTATKFTKDKEDSDTKIKWRKLITSTLKSKDGVLKIRKLKKLVLNAIAESGITEDEERLSTTFEEKINSSSRFRVDNKYVHLVAKED